MVTGAERSAEAALLRGTTRHVGESSEWLEEAAKALGVELLPWQREIGQRVLDGERIMVVRGRRGGWTTLARVLDQATHSSEPEPTS